MAIVVTHTCDRCGHTQKEFPRQDPAQRVMHQIEITIFRDHARGTHDASYSALWCQNCCLERSVITRARGHSDPPQTPPPSFEDMLRDFIREEVANADR